MSSGPIGSGEGPVDVGSRIARVTAVTAGALLGLAGLIAHPVPVLIGWLLATLLVGPFTAMCVHSARPHDGSGPHDGAGHVRAGVTATLGTMGGVAVLAGLIAVLGVAAGLLVAMLPGTWLVVRSHRRRTDSRTDVPRRPGRSTRVTAESTAANGVMCLPVPLVGSLHLVSTAGLCLAWQRSFWLLRELGPGDRHIEVVELRRAVLDELELRDPGGFSRWLGAEPRANSDPGRFLTTDH